MNQTTVTKTENAANHVITFFVHNENKRQLRDDRDYVCRELKDMELLYGTHVIVGEIDAGHREFRIDIPFAIRGIPGAFEWLEKLVNDVVG